MVKQISSCADGFLAPCLRTLARDISPPFNRIRNLLHSKDWNGGLRFLCAETVFVILYEGQAFLALAYTELLTKTHIITSGHT